ncbi:MAG: glycosyltransferase family 4 protein [Anaerolineae bacterium]
MRILVLSNYYPPFEVGGYEQLCRDIANRLAERGNIIAVLTSNRGVEKGNFPLEPFVYRLWQIQPVFDSKPGVIAQFFLTRNKIATQNRQIFQQIIREFRPDVVFIWNLQGLPHELTLDAEALTGVAVVYWLAAYTPAEPDLFWRYWASSPGKRSYLQPIKTALGKLAIAQMQREGKPVRPVMQHVAVVSDYMRRKGWQEGTLPAHAEVIYNGVETDLFFRPVPPPDTPPPMNFLLAGRVSEDKGIHIAVEAIGKLARSRPQRDFHLLLAGSGPETYLTRLQQLAADYQITDLISFLGWLPREQMPALMHRSHVLILTSIYPEAFARVVLEGMAAGLAVVGTMTGGTGEILRHDVTGLACAPDNSDDMVQQMARILQEPMLRYQLASRAQSIVLQQYTMNRMVDQIENLLERAVAEQVFSRLAM